MNLLHIAGNWRESMRIGGVSSIGNVYADQGSQCVPRRVVMWAGTTVREHAVRGAWGAFYSGTNNLHKRF